MVAAGHSVGVAAPQIGVTRRVVVVDVSKSKLGRDNNHGLLADDQPGDPGARRMRDDARGVHERPRLHRQRQPRRIVSWSSFSTGRGRSGSSAPAGFEAVAIQHELDHLDGYLFLDRVSSLKTDVFRRKK